MVQSLHFLSDMRESSIKRKGDKRRIEYEAFEQCGGEVQ